MKKIVRRLLNAAGYDISRIGSNNETIENLLENIFRNYSVGCVIDVGANTGQYGKSLRKNGYSGHIVSFEPVRSVFEELKETAKGDPKWHCYNLALGETSENKIINVYSSSVFASFLDANDYAKGIWKSLEKSEGETVAVVRLDDVIDEIRRLTECNYFYLKLDTQGFDQYAFRGAKDTLKYVVAMQTELSMIHVYESMPNPLEILREFTAPGFFVAGMFPINRDQSLAVIEFDCVLVRRPI